MVKVETPPQLPVDKGHSRYDIDPGLSSVFCHVALWLADYGSEMQCTPNTRGLWRVRTWDWHPSTTNLKWRIADTHVHQQLYKSCCIWTQRDSASRACIPRPFRIELQVYVFLSTQGLTGKCLVGQALSLDKTWSLRKHWLNQLCWKCPMTPVDVVLYLVFKRVYSLKEHHPSVHTRFICFSSSCREECIGYRRWCTRTYSIPEVFTHCVQ